MTYGVALQGSTVCTIGKESGTLSEFRETGDGEVLLVGLRRLDDLFSLLHAVQHVGLAILVTVGSDAKVDFARVLVSLERFSDACGTRRLENFELLRAAGREASRADGLDEGAGRYAYSVPTVCVRRESLASSSTMMFP